MGSANFTIPLVVQSPGNVIYSAEMNAEFTNISTNFNPAGMSGYQDSLAQKQLQEDPATGLVTSLAKEVEQLRFAVKRILGETYWYTAPSTDLNSIGPNKVTGPSSATDDSIATFDGTTGKLIQNNANVRLDNANSAIRLYEPSVGTDYYDLRVSPNSSRDFEIWFNGNQKMVLYDESANEMNGLSSVVIRQFANISGDTLQPTSNIATSSTPDANKIYANSAIKAWGKVTSAGVLSDGFNVSSINKTGTGSYEITLRRAMANTSYSVIGCLQAGNVGCIGCGPSSTTVFTVSTFSTADVTTFADRAFHFMILGTQ